MLTRERACHPLCLLLLCSHLERLSAKDATWCVGANPIDAFPTSQGALIKMARRSRPALQWLRSDLTAEAVPPCHNKSH